MLFVVLYASAISPAIGLISPVIVPRDAAIMSLMLLVATLITICCKVDISDIASESSVFKSGMVACVCVLGVAWLGDTFVSGHTAEIKTFAADTVVAYPALLAVVFFFAAMLLYSQAATAKAITPAIVAALGIWGKILPVPQFQESDIQWLCSHNNNTDKGTQTRKVLK